MGAGMRAPIFQDFRDLAQIGAFGKGVAMGGEFGHLLRWA